MSILHTSPLNKRSFFQKVLIHLWFSQTTYEPSLDAWKGKKTALGFLKIAKIQNFKFRKIKGSCLWAERTKQSPLWFEEMTNASVLSKKKLPLLSSIRSNKVHHWTYLGNHNTYFTSLLRLQLFTALVSSKCHNKSIEWDVWLTTTII